MDILELVMDHLRQEGFSPRRMNIWADGPKVQSIQVYRSWWARKFDGLFGQRPVAFIFKKGINSTTIVVAISPRWARVESIVYESPFTYDSSNSFNNSGLDLDLMGPGSFEKLSRFLKRKL